MSDYLMCGEPREGNACFALQDWHNLAHEVTIMLEKYNFDKEKADADESMDAEHPSDGGT